MGEFKQSGMFSINLSDERLDNAQYILLSILNKFKIKLEADSPSNLDQVDKALLSKITNNISGISIGSMSNAFGNFEFFLNGIPKIYTPQGKRIVKSDQLKDYLFGNYNLNMDSLHFETKSYIKVINHSHPENYYGVFYSLRDAIKICSENDLVKVGEVTS